MSFSLLVPIAADKPESKDVLPYVFSLGEDGIMLCVKSILGLNLSIFDSIYFTVLQKHNQLFYLSDLFNIQFKRLGILNAKVVVLSEPTSCQANTVYQTIINEEIEGSIFVKDADGFFSGEIFIENGVAVYSLDKLTVVNPQNKSYVSIDEMYNITNIIEKKIISRYFNAGGYCFEDVKQFCRHYNLLKSLDDIYMSHIVYSMLLERETFKPFLVEQFIDWGDSKLYKLNLYKSI